MFYRIVHAHQLALKGAQVEVAMEQYNAEVTDPQVTEIPRQPNARERALHEVTHVPFRPWCQHCVATRSHGDHASVADPEDAGLRERPTVHADFFFCEERSEDTKYILLMVDTWTRCIHAGPLKVGMQQLLKG